MCKRSKQALVRTIADCCGVQAMLHVTQCLATLHEAGFVHRDVKPGSILWLPSEQRWALVNFCRSCRVGHTGPAPCSLAYTAPEVAAAVGAGTDAAAPPASQAADAWALGIVIYELFSRQRALDVRAAGMEGVRCAACCDGWRISEVFLGLVVHDCLLHLGCNLLQGHHGSDQNAKGNPLTGLQGFSCPHAWSK